MGLLLIITVSFPKFSVNWYYDRNTCVLSTPTPSGMCGQQHLTLYTCSSILVLMSLKEERYNVQSSFVRSKNCTGVIIILFLGVNRFTNSLWIKKVKTRSRDSTLAFESQLNNTGARSDQRPRDNQPHVIFATKTNLTRTSIMHVLFYLSGFITYLYCYNNIPKLSN
jgi:hypothetical protein